MSLSTALRIEHHTWLSLSAIVDALLMNLNLENHPRYGARLAWGELGRMCHGTTPTEHALIETLRQLIQVYIMNY